jgi:hypothetical protein
MNRCACLVFALVLAAVPALANIPAPDLCVLSNPAGTDGAIVFTVPDGSGAAFTEARLGGADVDATLTLTVVNSNGDPIEAYPAEDIWLATTAGGLVTCAEAHPMGPTDASGQTMWVDPIAGGGSSVGEQAQAIIAGDVVPTTADVVFVSADMNGSLTVDLSDIGTFTPLLSTADPTADFNADGIVNLSDISLMTQGVGTVCP